MHCCPFAGDQPPNFMSRYCYVFSRPWSRGGASGAHSRTMMPHATIYDGLRTPFSRHAGRSPQCADGLLAGLLKVVRRAGVPAAAIGTWSPAALQAGEDAAASLAMRNSSGLPRRSTGDAQPPVRLRRCRRLPTRGAGDPVRGRSLPRGGVESMARAPFVMAEATGHGLGPRVRSPRFHHRRALLSAPRRRLRHGFDARPPTAAARDLGIGRAESDAYALRSQEKYEDGARRQLLREILLARSGNRPERSAAAGRRHDEHPRPLTTLAQSGEAAPALRGRRRDRRQRLRRQRRRYSSGRRRSADRHGLSCRAASLPPSPAGVRA